MRLIRHTFLSLGLFSLCACGADAPSGGADHNLFAAEPEFPVGDAGAATDGGNASNDGAVRLPDSGTLSCPRGGETGPVRVVFGCGEITVITCKDLSNVVIELDDGSRVRHQGLKGQQNGFVAPTGRSIVGVWVKAGSNASGDGPGYGERFDAPAGTCPDAGVGAPDSGTGTSDAGVNNPPPVTPPPQQPPPPVTQEPPPPAPPGGDGPGLVD